MSDLVERLRNKDFLWTVPGALREEAANRIEALETTLRQLAVITEHALAGWKESNDALEGKS